MGQSGGDEGICNSCLLEIKLILFNCQLSQIKYAVNKLNAIMKIHDIRSTSAEPPVLIIRIYDICLLT